MLQPQVPGRLRRGLLLVTTLGTAFLFGSLPLAAASPTPDAGSTPGTGTTSQGLATVPTNLPNVFAFPAPPAGFDPTTATMDELRRYGLPLPPDRAQQPEAYAQWADAMHHAQHFVVPSFTVHPEIRHNATSQNWSGTVTTAPPAPNPGVPPPFTLTDANGYWTVPSVANSTQTSYSATWVGLDGARGLNNQVEQIGTAQDYFCSLAIPNPLSGGCVSSVGGYAVYSAWYELYPDPSVTINNLPVFAGNPVYAGVGLDPSQAGTLDFIMINMTSNQVVAFQTAATHGVPGVSAEWIEERPTVQIGNNPPFLAPLADFGTVDWKLMLEGTSDGDKCFLPGLPSFCKNLKAINPTLEDMTSNGQANGKPLAHATWPSIFPAQRITWLAYQ